MRMRGGRRRCLLLSVSTLAVAVLASLLWSWRHLGNLLQAADSDSLHASGLSECDASDAEYASVAAYLEWVRGNRRQPDDATMDCSALEEAPAGANATASDAGARFSFRVGDECKVPYSAKRRRAPARTLGPLALCEELELRELSQHGTAAQRTERARRARCLQWRFETAPTIRAIAGAGAGGGGSGAEPMAMLTSCNANLGAAPQIRRPSDLDAWLAGGACSVTCTRLRSRRNGFSAFHLASPSPASASSAQGRASRIKSRSTTAVLVLAQWRGADENLLSKQQPYCFVNVAKSALSERASPAGFEESYTLPANRGDESAAYLAFVLRHYRNLPSKVIFHHGAKHAWHDPTLAELLRGFPDLHPAERHPLNGAAAAGSSRQSRELPELLNAIDVEHVEYLHLPAAKRGSCKRVRLDGDADLAGALEAHCAIGLAGQRNAPQPRGSDEVGTFWAAEFAVSRARLLQYNEALWQEVLLFVLDDPCHRHWPPNRPDAEYGPCRCDGPDSRGCLMEPLWPLLLTGPRFKQELVCP